MKKNISAMKLQLKKLGLSIDWDREISTCTRNIISTTSIFLIFLKRISLQKENYVNWDPVDETVLANEQG